MSPKRGNHKRDKQPTPAATGPPTPPPTAPKLIGGDIETAGMIDGVESVGGTGHLACRAVLREVRGVAHRDAATSAYDAAVDDPDMAAGMTGATPDILGDVDGNQLLEFYDPPEQTTPRTSVGSRSGDDYSYRTTGGGYGGSYGGYGGSYGYNPQDYGRKYLPTNGGCMYEDLFHLEMAFPEVLSAFDHVAVWHAMLRTARDAMDRANAGLPEGQRIRVLVNNSDGLGNSYGSHLNVLLTRRCWDNIFNRKLHHMLYLATYQASSILFTGAGKAGVENDQPHVGYQMAQRPDFMETLTGVQTTHRRPIVNSRDESLCGPSSSYRSQESRDGDYARLHVIFYDSTLCHVASLLKIGVLQLFLAMVEQEQIRTDLVLDDPLSAVLQWSHDLSLTHKAKLASGAAYTMIEVQSEILSEMHRFVAQGKAEGIVPRAQEILDIFTDVIEAFRQGDFVSLARKIDWVLKFTLLDRALTARGLGWDAPEAKHLDHLYSSLDVDEGLYWACERGGAVDRVATDAQIERFVHEPPTDTRAWLRAQILRRVSADEVATVNWDEIRLKFRRADDTRWPMTDYYTLPMHNPLGFTRHACEQILNSAATVPDAVIALGGYKGTRSTQSASGAGQIVVRSQYVAGADGMLYRTNTLNRHPNR